MCDRFIPPYKRGWRKKFQRLEQGYTSRICCGIVEDTEDKIVRFYGGLRHEIHDIVYHKESNTVNCLFQPAMLAEN